MCSGHREGAMDSTDKTHLVVCPAVRDQTVVGREPRCWLACACEMTSEEGTTQ